MSLRIAGRKFDVVIAGGGPAGAAAAIHLARSGYSVLIADAGPGRQFPRGESLPADALQELSAIGCHDSFLANRHPRLHAMCSLWGSDSPQFRDSFVSPLGSGWILDRVRFEATLLAEAESAGVSVRQKTRVVGVNPCNDSWTVTLRDGPGEFSLRAGFLVDATGRRAIIGRELGARRLNLDRLVAVCSVLPGPTQFSDCMSTIESFRHGWWYSAPLPNGQLVVSLFSDSDLVRSHCLASPRTWLRWLRESSLGGKLVPPDRIETSLRVCSAASQIVDCGGVGWLGVGDAASSWDPLASAGITMALRTGAEASRAIQASLAGDPDSVQSYIRRILFRTQCYIDEAANLYAAEERWPDEPFWKRRRGGRNVICRMPPSSPRIQTTRDCGA